MMSRVLVLTLALAVSISAPASAATPFSFEGPGEDASLFAIGWSKNEARFAYGFFATTSMIANGSIMAVKVQDLRTDKVLFSKVKIWDEGNAGGGAEGYYPKSGKEAYGRLAQVIGKGLRRLKISVPARPVQREGLEEKSIETLFEEGVPIAVHSAKGPSVDLKIEVLKEKEGYELYAIAPGKGQKKIGTIPSLQAFRTLPVGFAISPKATRMALILREDSDGPYSDYSVIGCGLKSGFKDLGLDAAGIALKRKAAACEKEGGKWSQEEGRCGRPSIEAVGLRWDLELERLKWPDGVAYCQARGKRMPTREELDKAYEANVKELRGGAGYYWSSETDPGDETRAFYRPRSFRSSNGTKDKSEKKTSARYVRCVEPVR